MSNIVLLQDAFGGRVGGDKRQYLFLPENDVSIVFLRSNIIEQHGQRRVRLSHDCNNAHGWYIIMSQQDGYHFKDASSCSFNRSNV